MDNLSKLLKPEQIRHYLTSLEEKGVAASTLKRKEAALNKFIEYAKAELGLGAPEIKPQPKLGFKKPSISLPLLPQIPLPRFFTYAALLALTAALGIFGYDQLVKRAQRGLAYPASLTSPNRVISFQGRLTDSGGTPITSATNFVFKLYDDETSGNNLWTSNTCQITPDQDGIFIAQLGDTGGGPGECGGAISASVFSENIGVWLEVTVASEVMDPRQPIGTSAYALNAETVQGFPPGTSTGNILYIDSLGKIGIGVTSPTIDATNSTGTLGIQAKAIVLSAANASSGDITINPDDTGVLDLIFEGSAPGGSYGGFVNAANANLTSGALYFGQVASAASGYDFLQFKSGASPTEKFSIDSAGNTFIAGKLGVGTSAPASVASIAGGLAIGTTSPSSFYHSSAIAPDGGVLIEGNVGIGTTSPGYKLEVAGQVKITGGSPGAGKVLTDFDGTGLGTWTAFSSIGVGGSGTENYISKWLSSSTLGLSQIFDNSTFVGIGGTAVSLKPVLYVSAAGNVGIGTTLPGSLLDVVGDIRANRFVDRNATNYFVDPGNTDIAGAFSGNVGIGTSSPTYKLHVVGDGYFSTNVGVGATTSTATLSLSGSLLDKNGQPGESGQVLSSTVSGVDWIDPPETGVGGSGTQNYLPKWLDSTTLTNAQLYDNGTFVGIGGTAASSKPVLYVSALGNVGIGTTSPAATLDIFSPATTGNALNLSANYLTSGYALNLSSTSTALTTGGLLNLDWSPTMAISSTGDLVSINIGSSANVGNIFNIKDSGSSLFSVSETTFTSNLPANFASPGDVSMAYDLLFTNTTVSRIQSAAPLYIEAGETFNSSDLTLATYNSGNVIVDSEALVTMGDIHSIAGAKWQPLSDATNALNIADSGGTELVTFNTTDGRVGIGTTAPLAKLHVEGQCITADSLLPIRRKKYCKGEKDDDEDFDYLLCPIKNILPGDEVLSLNEETGKVQYSPIKELKDMGIQEVFEIKTASGRKIRTTANHPYLVKLLAS